MFNEVTTDACREYPNSPLLSLEGSVLAMYTPAHANGLLGSGMDKGEREDRGVHGNLRSPPQFLKMIHCFVYHR